MERAEGPRNRIFIYKPPRVSLTAGMTPGDYVEEEMPDVSDTLEIDVKVGRYPPRNREDGGRDEPIVK